MKHSIICVTTSQNHGSIRTIATAYNIPATSAAQRNLKSHERTQKIVAKVASTVCGVTIAIAIPVPRASPDDILEVFAAVD